jgi:sulfatase modifying factor 1
VGGFSEASAHRVTLDGFWIDRHPVTARRFARFVRERGYVTIAERPLDPAAFPGRRPRTSFPARLCSRARAGRSTCAISACGGRGLPGACWRHPDGRGSSLAGRLDHPVVHIAYEDACAHADWAGRRCRPRPKWEFAARGGLDGAVYVWGDDPEAPGERLAHYWHGEFRWRPDPGLWTTASVGAYAPNGHGLFDMAGNVWETDGRLLYASPPGRNRERVLHAANPTRRERTRQPGLGAARVRHLTQGHQRRLLPVRRRYCLRYRPVARRPQMIDTGMSQIGFRCVRFAESAPT